MKLLRRKALGFSLVEFAISLAVLIPIIFGTIDINNSLRAYNALSKGSEVALRCIYPTDGACMEAANMAPKRLFNWFDLNTSPAYYVRDVEYRGHGEWLSSPTYVFDTYQAKILNSVSFQIPKYTVSATIPTLEVSHPVSVWVKRSGLPWVVPNNLVNPVGRDVHFTYENQAHTFPETSYVHGAGQTVVSARNPTIRYVITLNHPLAGSGAAIDTKRAVFEAGRSFFDKRNALPVSAEAALGALVPANSAAVEGIKAIVYIKGTASRLPGNVTSKLALSIGGSAQGGQIFNQNGSINFYPRGVGQSAEHESGPRVWGYGAGSNTTQGRFASAREWTHSVTLHEGTNLIEISRTTLDDDGNAVYGWGSDQTWTLTDVQVYLPVYELRTFTTSCTHTSCVAPACQQFQNVPIAQSNTTASYPVAEQTGSITSREIGSHSESLGDFYSVSEAAQTTSCDSGRLSISEATPETITSQPCAVNFGATNDQQRMILCAPSHPALSIPGVTAHAVSWTEREITVPQNAAERALGGWDFSFAKRGCQTQFNFTAPPSLARYANYITPEVNAYNPSRTTYNAIDNVVGKPSDVKSTDARYACDQIKLDEMEFDGHSSSKLPANLKDNSIFNGLHSERADENGCGLDFKQDAITNGLPEQAWFKATSTPVREVKITQKPTNSCVIFREETNSGTPTQIASLLPEGIIPTECVGHACSSVFAGIDGSAPASQIGPDIEMAQELAYRAVVASYPHALTTCKAGSIDCLSTEIETDDANKPTSVTVRNSIRVPLNLLGGNPIILTHRQSRELESSFVK